MKKIVLSVVCVLAGMTLAATPTVTDVTAKQRYPWNGLVDITCKVFGINGTTNGLEFAVVAVIPDSENARNARHFWGVRSGTNLTDCAVRTNGDYRFVWDASADLGQVHYNNMVVRVTIVKRNKVQLWKGGLYWATTNIGADEPWEYGYYFWWGDTIGYKRENNAWVASDSSSCNVSFSYENIPTYNKSPSTLQSEGWVDSKAGTDVLVPEHDAAQIQWGGGWRMPTNQELTDLNNKCDWTWTTINGVNGYEVRGRGDYACNSIFLPAAGYGFGTSLYNAGSHGYYWSSVPYSDSIFALSLYFYLTHVMRSDYRCGGQSVRPVRGFTE